MAVTAAQGNGATPLSHAVGPSDPPIRDLTLGELLAWAAETTPDRLALITGVPDPAARRQWTYAELHEQALCTARALRGRFEPGERIEIGRASGRERMRHAEAGGAGK